MKIIQQIKIRAKALKTEIHALSIALSDSRTSLRIKVLIVVTVGYFLSPIDLIPDFIPVLGQLDDLVILPILIWVIIKLLPPNILEESRQKAKANPIRLTKNNWFVGAIFMIIWVLLLILFINFLQSKNLIPNF